MRSALFSLIAIALPYGPVAAHGISALVGAPISIHPAPQTTETQPFDENENAQLPASLQRQLVYYPTREPSGTIIIDTPHTYLYYLIGNDRAIRYGIGVGRAGYTWSGVKYIVRKQQWPDWYPPPQMIQRQPYLPRMVAGGPGNPLGARALYIGGTEYRIHGTNDQASIGKYVSSGCIRLTNDNVVDLYNRVTIGAKVIVLPMEPRHHVLTSPVS